MRHWNRLNETCALLFCLAASGLGGCSAPVDDDASDTEEAPLSAAQCAAAPAWAPNVSYARNAPVRYQGKAYECIQAHTSLSTWTPDVTPALWGLANCEGGGAGSGSGGSGGSAGKGGSGGSTGGTGGSAGKAGSGGTGGGGGKGGTGGVGGSGGAGGGGGKGGAGGAGGSGGAGGGGAGGGTGGAAGGSGGGSGGGSTELAPYFYTWGWGNPAYPFTSLVDLKAKSGLDGVTLAFVLSSGGCAATQDVPQHQGDVNAFRAGGGRVKASFGGANGTYLENACADDASLANAIKQFVSQTGINDLDFDVEQAGAVTAEVNGRRARALKLVQDQAGVKVSFTLPTFPRDAWGTPGGLSAASQGVLAAAVQAGVRLSHVNLMTMDYGPYYSNGRTMAECATSALTDAATQLRAIVPGLGEADAWKMLGATPMIGQNDVASEVFTLADAGALTAFVKAKKIGLLSFWAINRDQACAAPNLALCSQVNAGPFDFTHIFQGVR
ncbi:MAG: glycosyl hydrolase family 18 protein [Polyangiaceae bacterium]|jgi:chitinase|nr:glycosyl hydrolase family 18 protein [Polyangiaceae bacterium]